ncbi:MAG: ribonuclease P protein component 1 [Halodesulfurarchaeum sp.]
MALTPETLPRHELVGLPVRVQASTDPSRTGIEGRVVRETMQTLLIETGASGVKQVPKAGTTFRFELTDEAAAAREGAGTVAHPSGSAGPTGEAAAAVTVDGAILLSRPALRTEHGAGTQWR